MARWTFSVVALGGLALAGSGGEADKKAIEGAVKKLQGTWAIQSVETDGKAVPLNDPVKQFGMIFKGDRCMTALPGLEAKEFSWSIVGARRGVFDIDFVELSGPNKGPRVLAILVFSDEDTIRLCNNTDGKPDKARPTQFETKPGSGYALWTFTRVKGK
jgi:uncharacterized protein (TIGR03067 family)